MKHFDLPAAIIFGISALQGVFITINLIFQNKGSRRANIFLMAMITAITLIIFQNFIILSGSYTELPYLIFPFYPLNGLIGPLFLMYVLHLLYPNRKFKIYDLLHLGMFLYMTYSHLDFLRLPDETKISAVDYFYYSDHQFNGAMMLNLIFNKTVLFGYGLASIYFIHTKIKEAKNWSSDTNLQYLNKFNLVAYLFLAYTISSILGPLYSYTFEVTIGRYEIYHHIVNSIVVLFLAVIAIQQPERLAFILQPKPIEINNTPSYQPVLNHLKEIMIELKPYLNPNLTLYDLANLVNIPSHNLSDQINKELKVNFYGFINNYRVEEFKERIISSEYNHLTFLAVAHDVGFNSKASFNRIFKKHMEMTPRQFLNQKKVSTSEIESSIS